MDKIRNKSKRSAKNVLASTDDMIDQYIQSQETKMTEFRQYMESQAEKILTNAKTQQEEALMKFHKYDQMTLGELKNVDFEETTTTKRIRKNRSKSTEVIKVAPSARKRKSNRSAPEPKIDETPTESSQAASIEDQFIKLIQRNPQLVTENLLKQLQIIRENLQKILDEGNQN